MDFQRDINMLKILVYYQIVINVLHQYSMK
jgi:hypothetical protein